MIVLGTSLLSLPLATADGSRLPLIDALFTATSATAVTGLVVRDTGTFFSPFGQWTILALIQIGGLGLMTMSTLFALFMGRRIGLRERLLIQSDLGQVSSGGLIRLVRRILLFTLVIEGVGALFLFLRWVGEMGVARGAFFALFHSVSAFANAGFDLFGNSLEGFASDPVVVPVIATLFILGGLGFAVMHELLHLFERRRLSCYSRLVLAVSGGLLVLGFISIFVLEYGNPYTLGGLGFGGKILSAFFTAATPRTAGFNTVPTGLLQPATLFLMIILMFIGASPGSTGGGVKTTTFGVLVAGVWSVIRGKEDVVLYERRVSIRSIFDAMAIVALAVLLICGTILALLLLEDQEFLPLAFEATSAFGTVGLSMGVTGELSPLSRLLLSLVMFAGRVGPLTLGLALGQRLEKTRVRYAEERIMVG